MGERSGIAPDSSQVLSGSSVFFDLPGRTCFVRQAFVALREPREAQTSQSLSMAEQPRYRIPKRDVAEIERERRSRVKVAVDELRKDHPRLSCQEAARLVPGADHLLRGKRAKSQMTGPKAQHFIAERRNHVRTAADVAAAARHQQLRHYQHVLQATADRNVAAEEAAEANAQVHRRRLEESLERHPTELYYMSQVALKQAERAVDTTYEMTERVQHTVHAAGTLYATAKDLVGPAARLGLIAGHTLADALANCEKEVKSEARHAIAFASASNGLRPSLEEQKTRLASWGDDLHAARMKVLLGPPPSAQCHEDGGEDARNAFLCYG